MTTPGSTLNQEEKHMKTLAKNKAVKKLARKPLWMKKYQPAKYQAISTITDSMILGVWMLVSVGVALWLVDNGYTTFDSAMMGLCLVDLNVLIFSILTDTDYYEEID